MSLNNYFAFMFPLGYFIHPQLQAPFNRQELFLLVRGLLVRLLLLPVLRVLPATLPPLLVPRTCHVITKISLHCLEFTIYNIIFANHPRASVFSYQHNQK
jgi:hypothetical protein